MENSTGLNGTPSASLTTSPKVLTNPCLYPLDFVGQSVFQSFSRAIGACSSNLLEDGIAYPKMNPWDTLSLG